LTQSSLPRCGGARADLTESTAAPAPTMAAAVAQRGFSEDVREVRSPPEVQRASVLAANSPPLPTGCYGGSPEASPPELAPEPLEPEVEPEVVPEVVPEVELEVLSAVAGETLGSVRLKASCDVRALYKAVGDAIAVAQSSIDVQHQGHLLQLLLDGVPIRPDLGQRMSEFGLRPPRAVVHALRVARGPEMHLSVTRCPEKDLAFTNCAYLAEEDLARLCTLHVGAGTMEGRRVHVEVAARGQSCILEVAAHPAVPVGQIALNYLHRGFLRRQLESELSVQQVDAGRGPKLSRCRIEVAPFRQPAEEEVSEDESLDALRQFTGQFISVGQTLPIPLSDHRLMKAVIVEVEADVQQASSGILVAGTEVELVPFGGLRFRRQDE